MCGVPLCGPVLCFRLSCVDFTLVFLMLLSSWSKCALEGVDNASVVLLYFRSIFPTWCVSNVVHTMVLVLTCFCCGLLMWHVAYPSSVSVWQRCVSLSLVAV